MDKIYLDLEFIDDKLLCVGFKWGHDVTQVQPDIDDVLALKEALADPEVIKVCHSKADWRWLLANGYELAGPLEDTMVKAWVLNENTPLDLEYCAKRYCNITMDKRIKSVAKEPHFRCDDGAWVHLKDAPLDQVMKYNKEDVEATFKLNEELDRRLKAEGWWGYYVDEQRPFTEVLVRMEDNGLPLDMEAAEKLRKRLVPKINQQVGKLDTVLGYPLRLADGRPGYGSNDLLTKVLFEDVWFQPAKLEHGQDISKATLRKEIAERDGKKPSQVTEDEVALEKENRIKVPPGFELQKVTPKNLVGYYTRRGYGLPPTPPADPEAKNPKPSTAMPVLLSTFPDHPFIKELQEWSKMRKVLTTYLDAYPRFYKDGRIHGTFSQTGTKTGRLSSARPNLQNQPAQGWLGKEVRRLFKGRLVVGDYGQLEPRLLAHFSQDPKLLEVYDEGLDIYAVTAAGIFGGSHKDYHEKHPKRMMSKPLFLGDQYGAGAKKLWVLLRLNGFSVSLSEVQMFQDRLHSTYSTATAWKEGVKRTAKVKGYVETLDGHRRRLDFGGEKNWKNRGYGERQAVNAIIQGSAGDVVRRCMVMAHKEFPELHMLAQVHDEVLWEASPMAQQKDIAAMLWDVQYVMEEGHGFDLSVPLKFDPQLAQTWADKGHDGIEWLEE